MSFDWDDANREHLARHDVTPHEAEEAFLNESLDLEVQTDEVDVFRYKQIGETNAGRILVFLSTVRGNSIRMISAWDAPKAYKHFYLKQRVKPTWNR